MEKSKTDQIVGAILKGLLFDVVLQIVIRKAIEAAPWLAYRIVNPVFVFIMTEITERIYTALDETVDLAIIGIKNEAARTKYEAAVNELKKIIKEKGAESDAAKAAKEEFKKRLEDLIRLHPLPVN